MKYVIGTSKLSGSPAVVTFDEALVHVHIGAVLHLSGYAIRSAGFYYVKDGVVTVAGDRSDSLGVGPAEDDAELLGLFLREGLSGLSLANMMVYREIEKRKEEAPPDPPKRRKA